MQTPLLPLDEHRMLERFVYLEARLADESRFDEWEALWDESIRYWVPVVIDGQEPDPDRDASIINDNRSRLATRLRQLRTGTRHSQAPRSILRRMLSNLTADKEEDGDYRVAANFAIYEYQVQSVNQLNVWPGRVEYGLRQVDGQLRMFLKKVSLVHASGPLPSLSFLI
ncbi:aromatic-ring-hydroxylating dioxygenase subunit beta [Pigmentiphaga sp.]|uniref:aromatic-ring-hydroxylating dioxygenase subunit beta n=1 Tax=Pigmentiphaga sp. TaxID=1977564 RepID=UPI0026003EB1|nr:aromatic-ring-hydroxylating dioxygenase subunit beta [Pigmentiphaga sp.]